MKADYAILSDVGNVRQRNEDHAGGDCDRGIFLLADGMGGHPAGDLASRVAIETGMGFLTEPKVPGRARGRGQKLGQAIEIANRAILELGRQNSQVAGMGTTLIGLWLGRDEAHFAHVGDSRAYLYRGGEVRLLTRDHTLLRELIERGEIDEDSPQAGQLGHILTQAVGTEPAVRPDIATLKVRKRDLFLLCSDGLSDLLSVAQIADLLNSASAQNLDEKARLLVQAALEAGGHDNITVILARRA